MDKERNTSKLLLKGTFILTLSALFLKLLSAVYRIPFQNIVGDTGFYIYQQVYPLYGIIMVISSYGLPTAVSKMIAETDQTKHMKRQILSASIFWTGLFAGFSFLLLFFGANQIAIWMGDVQLASLIKVVSFAILIIPITSVIRGYFQGKQNMLPTALSQTLEQLFRVATILIFSMYLIHIGKDLYTVGAGAMFGAVIGGCAALLVLFIFVRNSHATYHLPTPDRETILFVGKVLLFQGVAFCLTNMLLVLLQLMDAFQLYNGLLTSSLPAEEAKILKGVFDRGQPLLQLGTVLSTSMGLSVVPLLSLLAKKHEDSINKIRLSMRLSVGIGLGAALGLILVLKPVNIMLFEDTKGTSTLMVLALTVFFASITITGATILQTLGSIRQTVLIILATVLIKFIGNAVFIPKLGISGAAVATVLAVMISAIAIYVLLTIKIQTSVFLKPEIYALFGAALVMTCLLIALRCIFPSSDDRLFSLLQATIISVLGGCIYVLLLFKFRFFKQEELDILPFGEKLAFILKK